MRPQPPDEPEPREIPEDVEEEVEEEVNEPIQILPDTGTCRDTNNGALDIGGDGCNWYEQNVGFCGNYDNLLFKANEMCCTCGGGTREEFIAVCHDTNNGFLDTGKDDCEYYVGREIMCGDFDTPHFNSTQMCCACGGGTTGLLTSFMAKLMSEESIKTTIFQVAFIVSILTVILISLLYKNKKGRVEEDMPSHTENLL